MTESLERFNNQKSLSSVGNFATPAAVFLVGLGIYFAQPQDFTRYISLGFLVFGLVFNYGFVFAAGQGLFTLKPWMVKLRQEINLIINIFLVYFLGEYWPPIWLLLALTPIATAVYGSRLRTIWASFGIAAVLFAVQYVRHGKYSFLDWGEQAAYGVFIILISLMVNELAGHSVSRRDFQRP